MNKLLPSDLSEEHEEVIKETTEKPNNFSLLNKEFMVPCQLSNGYFLIMNKVVKELPTYSNKMKFMVLFKMDRSVQMKSICYLLVDKKGMVLCISESIIFFH